MQHTPLTDHSRDRSSSGRVTSTQRQTLTAVSLSCVAPQGVSPPRDLLADRRRGGPVATNNGPFSVLLRPVAAASNLATSYLKPVIIGGLAAFEISAPVGVI